MRIRKAAELRRLFFAFIGKMLKIGIFIWRKNDFDFVYDSVTEYMHNF